MNPFPGTKQDLTVQIQPFRNDFILKEGTRGGQNLHFPFTRKIEGVVPCCALDLQQACVDLEYSMKFGLIEGL